MTHVEFRIQNVPARKYHKKKKYNLMKFLQRNNAVVIRIITSRYPYCSAVFTMRGKIEQYDLLHSYPIINVYFSTRRGDVTS